MVNQEVVAGVSPVDPDALREEVKAKYREVAVDPHGEFHFHTGRPLARRLGYDDAIVGSLPDVAVESFAGVANPFSLRPLAQGEKVVDIESGGGFDCFVAAQQVGVDGRVVGIDMTEEMLDKSRQTSSDMGFDHVEFREGLIEGMPIEDGWADVVISNGVVNLCPDKVQVFADLPCPQTRRTVAICRHRQRKSGAGGSRCRHRFVDCLNRWWRSV